MDIRKIKFKDGLVEIHSAEKLIGKFDKETIYKSVEKPSLDFEAAFIQLVSLVYDILEWPREYATHRVKVTGVSFSESNEGIRGAVLTGTVELETSNSPFCFNTPHLPFEQYSETGNSPLMPADGIERLETLEKEAMQFLEGKRAQLELAGTTGK